MWTRTLGAYACPDVAVTADAVWVVATGAPLPLWQFAHDGTPLGTAHPPGSGGFFPKTDGTTVLYHDGAAFHAWTPGADPADVGVSGQPVGNNPTGISPSGRRAFQTPVGVACDGVRVADYRPTGIWETHDDGTVTMMDACNRPAWAPGAGGYAHRAADLVVAEGPDGGIQITQDGQRHLLWRGTDTKWPRVSVCGDLAAIVSWGDNGLRVWCGTRAEIAALPLDVAAVVVPPAPAHLWGCGYFFRDSQQYGDNPAAPGTHSLVVDEPRALPAEPQPDGSLTRLILGLPCLLHEQVAAWWPLVDAIYVPAEAGVEALEQDAALARTICSARGLPPRPILSYTGAAVYPDALTDTDILGVQLYLEAGETETDLRAYAASVAPAVAHRDTALVVQAYDRNGTWTGADLAALQPVFYDLACAWPRCRYLCWFSDGRLGGTRSHPEMRPWHLAIDAALRRRTP